MNPLHRAARHLRATLAAAALGALALLAYATTAEAARGSGPLLLVAGATGQTGRLVLERAERAGYRVRALAREPERARSEIGDSWEWVKGDVREPATLAPVMRGVTYVICAIGATERSGPNSPEFVDYGGVRNLTDAARTAGVHQFVLISSTGTGGGGGAFGWLLNTVLMPGILDWKAKGEQYLRTSGLDYTILRPGGLSQDPGERVGLRFTQGDTLGGGTIARADVAMLAVHALGNPAVFRTTFEIAGDESAAPGAWKGQLATLRRD